VASFPPGSPDIPYAVFDGVMPCLKHVADRRLLFWRQRRAGDGTLVAMIYFLLLSWIKAQTKFQGSLLDLIRMVGEMLLQHVSLIDLLRLTPKSLPRALARAAPPQMALL